MKNKISLIFKSTILATTLASSAQAGPLRALEKCNSAASLPLVQSIDAQVDSLNTLMAQMQQKINSVPQPQPNQAPSSGARQLCQQIASDYASFVERVNVMLPDMRAAWHVMTGIPSDVACRNEIKSDENGFIDAAQSIFIQRINAKCSNVRSVNASALKIPPLRAPGMR